MTLGDDGIGSEKKNLHDWGTCVDVRAEVTINKGAPRKCTRISIHQIPDKMAARIVERI
jgi:hypothetical protein